MRLFLLFQNFWNTLKFGFWRNFLFFSIFFLIFWVYFWFSEKFLVWCSVSCFFFIHFCIPLVKGNRSTKLLLKTRNRPKKWGKRPKKMQKQMEKKKKPINKLRLSKFIRIGNESKKWGSWLIKWGNWSANWEFKTLSQNWKRTQ